MNLALAPNPLYPQSQSLIFDKVATLIGENGSGKSTILGSIFEQRLANEAHQNLNIVCFSSGQNENYSSKFSRYLRRERQVSGLSLECVYFDKSWSKLLIFLATATKRQGRVRSFLRERNYVQESQLGDDESTTFKTAFRVDRNYANQVQAALLREEAGEVDTIRATPYFRTLDSFISNLISNDYDFSHALNKTEISITA